MKQRILAIDDEVDVLAIVRGLLSTGGFAVDTAESGPEGLEKARANHPDLILLDLKMPEMNGLEVFERLRKDSETAMVPVIFLTAIDDSDLKATAVALGVDKYVTKPFDGLELIEIVRRTLMKDE